MRGQLYHKPGLSVSTRICALDSLGERENANALMEHCERLAEFRLYDRQSGSDPPKWSSVGVGDNPPVTQKSALFSLDECIGL